MKKLHLIGNLKMNLSKQELEPYFKELATVAQNTEQTVGVCVPFVYLPLAQTYLQNSKVLYGAQNMSNQISGAFTGEISASMLQDFGTQLVILGHSERRQLFGETDKMVNQKVLKALEENLTPILCVGETLQQRAEGKTKELVTQQLQAGLQGVNAANLQKMYIAYEPIWAIGTGKSASATDAEQVIDVIKQWLQQNKGATTNVLYGGSLKPSNAQELLRVPNIDGGLIGGASLNATQFADIINTQL